MEQGGGRLGALLPLFTVVPTVPGWQPLSAYSLNEGEKEGTKERMAQQPLPCRVDLAM